MTEQEWSEGDELWRMLHHLFDGAAISTRKQFLYCVAACHLRRDSMPADYLTVLADLETLADSPNMPVIPLVKGYLRSESYQAHLSTGRFGERLAALGQRARDVHLGRYATLLRPGELTPWEGDPRFSTDEQVMYALMGNPFASSYGDGFGDIKHSLKESNLLRELFGNPFRPIAVNAQWLTSDVITLATGIYEDRAFDRMPILADALQDAGCDNADVLEHCRGSGPHVRGCWVVDMLLGKS